MERGRWWYHPKAKDFRWPWPIDPNGGQFCDSKALFRSAESAGMGSGQEIDRERSELRLRYNNLFAALRNGEGGIILALKADGPGTGPLGFPTWTPAAADDLPEVMNAPEVDSTDTHGNAGPIVIRPFTGP